MERDINLTNKLVKFSKKIGIDIIGFANPEYFERYNKRNKPEHFLKDVKTIIVIGYHLFDQLLDVYSQNPRTGKSFQYADSILEDRGYQIKEFLSKQGFESEVISYNPGLYLKEAAAIAGIGPIGRNNLLLTEEFGSQVRLRALATNAPLVTGNPINESSYCVDCKICLEACPANAFSDGEYNRDRCLSYNQKNLKRISEFSEIWCNVCIESCPVYRKSKNSNA